MTDEKKNTKEQFQNCCENVDFPTMMETMISRKEELCGCGCLEKMQKIMPKSSWRQNQEK